MGDRPQVRPRPGATDWQCGPLRSGKRCARQQALDATAHQPFGLGPFRSRAQATVSARRVAPDLNRRQAASRRQPERYTAVRGVPSNRSLGEKQRMDIAELLAFSVKNKASDLHLSAGLPPMIRVDGDVRRINIPALDHKQVHALVYDIMSDKQRRDYEEFLEVDFSFEIPSLARFRVNAFNQNRGAGAVFRTIPS
ncbi:hypothetical protein QUT17_19040, partial [Xanthomonas citri pv. citri]